MDGVVVESTEVHVDAWDRYLAPFGADGAWVHRHMLGKRNDEIVRAVFGNELSPGEVEAHGAAKERLYRALMSSQLHRRMVAGIRQLLEEAHQQGVPCGLGTNAEPENVRFILEGLDLGRYFQATVDGHQVQKAKPHPEIYLRLAEQLGADPRNCVVFEDSPGGMAAAKAAGMRLVAVLTTLQKAEEASLAVHDFLDPRLPHWLAEQTAV